MEDINDIRDQITLTLEDDSELLCDVIAIFPAKYKGEERNLVYSVISSDELHLVIRNIKKIDSKAFIETLCHQYRNMRFGVTK